jgi:phosphatidylinositol alpha-1,6-mannosyltransferase
MHPVKAVVADSYKSAQGISRLEVPMLVLAHGMELPTHPSPAKALRIRRALAQATHIVANSRFTASRLVPYVGERRIEIIHPPIGVLPAPSAAALADMDRLIAADAPVIVSLSRLEPRKGIDQVIRAMPVLHQTYPRACFLVAGDGADRPRLEALAHEHGVAHAVRFLGRVDEGQKAALFSRADLFAMPVRREGNSVEGFGIVYMEAAWYGVPALAGREGGAVDAVIDGQTGRICAGDDLEDVTRTLAALLGDAAGRQRLGAAAQVRARGALQWGQAIRAYLDLVNCQ